MFYILKCTSSLVAIYFKTEYVLCLKCDEGMLQMLNKESAIVRCKTIKLIKELKEEKCKITTTIAIGVILLWIMN